MSHSGDGYLLEKMVRNYYSNIFAIYLIHFLGRIDFASVTEANSVKRRFFIISYKGHD